MSSPYSYNGYDIEFTGKIFVTERDESGWALQAYSNDDMTDDNIIVVTDSSEQFNEGDYIKVKAVAGDPHEGENAFGASLIAPVVYAFLIEKIDADQAIAPTLAEKEVGLKKKVGNLTIELKKIEYANKEARLFLGFDNKSTSDYSFYQSELSLVQDRSKKKEINDYNRDTYISDSDILAGTTEDFTLYFEALDASKPATLKLNVTNGDSYDTNAVTFIVR